MKVGRSKVIRCSWYMNMRLSGKLLKKMNCLMYVCVVASGSGWKMCKGCTEMNEVYG